MSVKCPKCGQFTSDQANFCPECGFALKNVISKAKTGQAKNLSSSERYYKSVKEFLGRYKDKQYYHKLVYPQSIRLTAVGHRLFSLESDVIIARYTLETAIMGGWKSTPKKKEIYQRKKEAYERFIVELESDFCIYDY